MGQSLHVYTCEKNHHCFIKEDGWLEKNKSCPIKWCKSPMRHDESCQRTSSHMQKFVDAPVVVKAPEVIKVIPKPVKKIEEFPVVRYAPPHYPQPIPQFGGIINKQFKKKKLPVLTAIKLKSKGYSLQQPKPRAGRGVWKRLDTQGRTWYKEHKLI